MTPEAIRNIGVNRRWTPSVLEETKIEILREIAAQLAEANQHARQRAEKKQVLKEHKTSVRSAARRSSTTKRFFVEHWMLEAEDTMLPPFQPGPDQKPIEDLAVGETTQGLLGTFSDARITRRQ
jgi:hypothetical protein